MKFKTSATTGTNNIVRNEIAIEAGAAATPDGSGLGSLNLLRFASMLSTS